MSEDPDVDDHKRTLAEIERLRAELNTWRHKPSAEQRNAIIEECAVVADAFAKENKPSTYIPAAIRALKPSPQTEASSMSESKERKETTGSSEPTAVD